MKTTFVNKRKGEKPNFNLSVMRVESSVWRNLGFYRHHYMTQDMNKGAKCFLFLWDDQPVGLFSILNQTFRGCNKNDHRGSRLVVMPQFQGLGFSKVMLDFVGGIIKSVGGTLYTKEKHDKLATYQFNSPKWEPSTYNNKKHHATDLKAKNRFSRISYCFKYIGEPLYGYEHLLEPIKDLRKKMGRS